jgi:hypothetical protein
MQDINPLNTVHANSLPRFPFSTVHTHCRSENMRESQLKIMETIFLSSSVIIGDYGEMPRPLSNFRGSVTILVFQQYCIEH